MEANNIGVFFRLDARTEAIARELVHTVDDRAALDFKLDDTRVAHITLFQGRIPDSITLHTLEREIRAIGAQFGELEVAMEQRLHVRPNGNVFWNAQKTRELENLHHALLNALQPRTRGLLMPQFQELVENDETPPDDKEQIRRFGSLLAGPFFLPHITLGRLKNVQDGKIVTEISVPATNLHLVDIGAAELNQDGSVPKSDGPQQKTAL